MPKFEILAGKHSQNGRIYDKGDVIQAPSDLTTVFKNKFKLVHRTTPVSAGAPIDSPGQRSLMEAIDKPVKKDKGEDDEELDKVAAKLGKKPRVPQFPPDEDEDADDTDAAADADDADEDEEPAPKAVKKAKVPPKAVKRGRAVPDGVDKTAVIPGAEEQDIKVYKSGGLWYAYDADDLSKPINKEGVEKSAIGRVIDKYLIANK